MQEIKEKSEKSGGILGLKKIKETFALIEEAKITLNKKESLKYMKVKDKDGNETTVHNLIRRCKKSYGNRNGC